MKAKKQRKIVASSCKSGSNKWAAPDTQCPRPSRRRRYKRSNMIAAGAQLFLVKSVIPHGTFLDYLKTKSITRRSASRWIAIARSAWADRPWDAAIAKFRSKLPPNLTTIILTHKLASIQKDTHATS